MKSVQFRDVKRLTRGHSVSTRVRSPSNQGDSSLCFLRLFQVVSTYSENKQVRGQPVCEGGGSESPVVVTQRLQLPEGQLRADVRLPLRDRGLLESRYCLCHVKIPLSLYNIFKDAAKVAF